MRKTFQQKYKLVAYNNNILVTFTHFVYLGKLRKHLILLYTDKIRDEVKVVSTQRY